MEMIVIFPLRCSKEKKADKKQKAQAENCGACMWVGTRSTWPTGVQAIGFLSGHGAISGNQAKEGNLEPGLRVSLMLLVPGSHWGFITNTLLDSLKIMGSN